MALVTALQSLYDRTLDIYYNPPPQLSRATPKEKHMYRCLQISAKVDLFKYNVKAHSCAASGVLMDQALIFLESRSNKECGKNDCRISPRVRAATLQGFQSAALALGLPVVGGVVGIVNGMTEILEGLSIRRKSRVDARASHMVTQRANLARRALERLEQLGSNRAWIAALLREPRYEDGGVSYGKTPHSRLQAKARWDAIVESYPKGLPSGIAPPERRRKYEEYAATAPADAILRAMRLADRILAAIARNEKNAIAQEASSETTALTRIAMGVASMFFGAAVIAFHVPAAPALLAALLLHGLHHGLITGPTRRAADDSLVEDIVTLLEDRSPGQALGRKFVKAVLRENGMDGAGPQILHFALACKGDWNSAWEVCVFRDSHQQPDLLEHARRVVRIQLGALLAGSTARDVLTQERGIQRCHLPNPYRRPAMNAFIEDVPDD